MRGRWRSWRAPGSVSNVFVFFHYLLWKAKLNFDCLELKRSSRSHQSSIQSGFHCLLRRYENPSLHYTPTILHIPSCWSSIGLPPSSGTRGKSHSSGNMRSLPYSTRKATRRSAETTAASRSYYTRVRFSLKWSPGDSALTVR